MNASPTGWCIIAGVLCELHRMQIKNSLLSFQLTEADSPSPSSLRLMTMHIYFTMVIKVSVQKMMETAPRTCNGVGSSENTFGNVYSGDVPEQQLYHALAIAQLPKIADMSHGCSQGCLPKSPKMTPTA